MDTNRKDSNQSPASNSTAADFIQPVPVPFPVPGMSKKSSTNAKTNSKPETTKDNLQYRDK